MAYSLVFACLFCAADYFAFRTPKAGPGLDVHEMLNRSIQVEATSLAGQTEHQVLRFEESEESSVKGQIVERGTIDLWKDGDGKRHMRRLCDEQHRPIAADWMERNGEQGQYLEPHSTKPSETGSEFIVNDLWKQDLLRLPSGN
jgi:hypothetical protein